MRTLRWIVMACLGVWIVPSALGAWDGDAGVVEDEVVLRDLAYLRDTLEAAHSDLYANRSREEYHRAYEDAAASIDGPVERREAIRLLTEFAAFGRVGHARVEFPVGDYVDYIQGGGGLIPIDIRVKGGRVLIAHNYSGADELEVGSEVVAINGHTASEWVGHIGRHVSAERDYMVHAQLEGMFPRLVWLVHGGVPEYEIVLALHDGEHVSVVVEAVPAMDFEAFRGEREWGLHTRTAELLGDGVAYLRPGPFYAARDGESLESVVSFYDHAFEEFARTGARDLIIDLRDNPGGDNSFSDPMIAWIADRPFRFASRYTLRASERTREVLRELAVTYPDGVSAEMFESMRAREDGSRFDFEIPYAKPRVDGRRFEGRVWALVNRHSYSNATAVAAIIQDYGFGLIIGEETADVPTSHASSANFILPGTSVQVTYPKAYFVRPSGDEQLSGVIPDHAIDYPIGLTGPDTVLDRAQAVVVGARP